MQDSIEDYIRVSKNIKSNSADIKISKEVLATAQRKKECEDYAMKIVMFLLDGKLRPEIFLKCLKYINQDYYQDVVEERAITKLCGYPLCGKKIPEMPKQKYFISTKANKVYDISERKNYCSNFCYKGSLYVKNQIDSSPLWLRNHKEMAECNLLPADAGGIPGEEIDQGVVKAPSELPTFTSVAQFAQFSLEEAEEIERTSKKKKTLNLRNKPIQGQQSSLSVINENDATDNEDELEKSDFEFQDSSDDEFSKSKNDHVSNNEMITDKCEGVINDQKYNNIKECKEEKTLNNDILSSKEPIVDNTKDKKIMNEKEKLKYLISKLKINNEPKTKLIEPPSMKNETKPKKLIKDNVREDIVKLKTEPVKHKATNAIKKEVQEVTPNNNNSFSEVLNKVKMYVKEWITLDTFIYLYGEDKVKQVLNENKMGEYFDELKITELETTQQLKYMNICRRLHMQELAEEKFDNAILGHSLKPLPDFRQLKEEVQELDLKVRSFYKGVLYEKPDTNFPTKPVKENEENEKELVVLPLVDVSAQNALRRKVFLNSIDKTLKKIIGELKLEENNVMSNIHDLVKSFKLQAHNIVFKPTTWPLVAVILLKMLSLTDKTIQNYLEEEKSVEYLDLILSKHIGIEKIVEEIFILLRDVDKFVECYITQNR